MAGKRKPTTPEYVAFAGGYGLREDGVWEVLPEGFELPAVPPADLEL